MSEFSANAVQPGAFMAAGLSLIGQDIPYLLLGKPACDVLLTIPVERIDVDEEDSFDRQRRRA